MAEIRKSQPAEASASYKQQGQRQGRSTTPPSGKIRLPPNNQDETNRKKWLNGKCFRCGSNKHALPKCTVPITATCPSCNYNGHTKYACHKAMAHNIQAEEQMDHMASEYHLAGSVSAVSLMTSAANQPTPNVTLRLAPAEQPNQRHQTHCLPDTGCTQTIVSAKFYKQFNLKLRRNQNIPLFSANGGKITVLGSANVIFSTSTCKVSSTVLVATDMTHPVLLSWHDMIKLAIISASFPWPTVASVESSVRGKSCQHSLVYSVTNSVSNP